MNTNTAALSVPVSIALAAVIGWLVHGPDFGSVVIVYVIVGAVVGVGLSVAMSRHRVSAGRGPDDSAGPTAQRDARSAAFVDVLLVLLVSSVVFALADPTRGLAAFVPFLAALALIDAGVRERRLAAGTGQR